ncbi:monovalent cation/H(+) antiporter subunit G [Acetomicrobium sp. UBA5826]|uniref:monovalent cation/H(+) antiporter subunit G n=1 Tax=Acetomicrobium sp. UBA5826 TaxID=1946039 RepID=UPI00257D22D5|nr:monovalent cation/H(+) antiporter subunit G [Acetomicrobium sp. UBA5826]
MNIDITSAIACAFMVVGVFFAMTSALGMIRFPDVYTRIHAGTKALTGGALMTLVGAALYYPAWQVKAKILLIALFFLITNPISSHAIARACYLHGIKPTVSYKDDYGENLNNNGEETER